MCPSLANPSRVSVPSMTAELPALSRERPITDDLRYGERNKALCLRRKTAKNAMMVSMVDRLRS